MTIVADAPPAVDALEVTAGVDTHADNHVAAVIDPLGRHLGDRSFPATPAGYRDLAAWMATHGTVVLVGVEGTGTYGAGLTRALSATGLTLVEVDRPDRKTRRDQGKSDPIDAYAAARAAASGRASGRPKTRTGDVESIRALRVARSGAVKARAKALTQLKALIVTAPAGLRTQLRGLDGLRLREDSPAYLSTVTENFCKRNGCALPGTDMGTGAQITAICQTTGARTTNGQDNSAVDDANPELYTTTRWYGIRWSDGRFGYLSEAWIAASDRGGLGLRQC